MTLVLTNHFKQPCAICNCVPVDETKETHPPLPMTHAEGVDINWGEDLNICKVCAGVIADLIGRPDRLKVQKLSKAHTGLREEYEALSAEHDALKDRIHKILEGKKAVKEQRSKSA